MPPKRNKLPPRVYWHRNKWQYFCRKDEKLITGKTWVPLGGTQEDLVPMLQAYAALQERLGQSGGMNKLFNKFEREILLDPSNPLDYSPRTIQDKLKHLTFLRDAFGAGSPTEIRPMHCAEYLDLRGKSSKSQANQEFNTLSIVFKMAVRWGVVDVNPCRGLSRHKIKDRDRMPSHEELEALKTVCDPFLKLYIDLKYKTGLRQKDLLELKIRDCNFNSEGIQVKTSKTGKKGFIPWDDELKDVIRGLLRLNKIQGETVICGPRGKPLSQNTFTARWGKAMTKAVNKGLLESRFWEHDIRARHATDAEDDHDLDASDQLLHNDKRTKQKYLRAKKAIRVEPLPLKKSDK